MTKTVHFPHLLLWQRIECGVVAKIPHALHALSASTEAGWIVSLKLSRALKV